MNFSKYLCFFFTIFSFGFISAQDVKLWYQQPATKWTDALPIGNGRLGAMIFGTVEKEHLQFNEETLWTGGPRDHHREGAYASLAHIRQLLFEGKQAEAEELATEKFMGLQSREGDRDRWVKSVQSLQGLKGNPALPDYDDSDWKMITVPSYEGWEIVGLE